MRENHSVNLKVLPGLRRKDTVNETPKKSTIVNRELLTVGAVLIIIVISLLLASANLIAWWMTVPLIIALCGLWVLALAMMQTSTPQKYAMSAFGLTAWGLFLLAIGGAWFLYGFGPIYSLALILIVVALVAIAAALNRKK